MKTRPATHSITQPARDGRRLSRRRLLRAGALAGLTVAALPLLAACGPAATSAPPAAPASTPAAAATAAPKPAAPAAAAQPTSAPPAPATQAPPAATQAAPAAAATVTLTFATSATTDSAEVKSLTTLFQAFEAANPSIKVELQPIPYDNFMQTLTTRVVGNQAPDAALLLDRFATAMVGQQALLPLDDKLPADYAKPFNKPAWDFATVDGHPYAIPLYANVQAIIYNADQFAKAGVVPPTKPEDAWLFGQVVEQAQKLKAANGTQYGLIHWSAGTPSRLSQYLVAEGGSVFTEDFSAPALETPLAIRLLGQIRDTFASGLSPKDNWSQSGVQPDPMFLLWANGQAPMMLASGNFQIANAVQYVADRFKWSFAFMPTTLGTPIELVAFKQTKRPAETVKLLTFLAEPANMAQMASKANLVPTRTDLPAGQPVYEQGTEQMKILGQQLSRASTRLQRELALPSWSEIDLMLRKQLEQLALGTTTPEQLAKDASAQMVTILDRYKKPA